MWGGSRLGFRTDVSCRIDVSRKEAKTQRRHGTGGRGCSLNVGWLNVGRSSWAALTSAARRLCDSYGAWKLARSTDQETRTTGGPRSRAQRGVYAIVMVLGNLRGLRAGRPTPRRAALTSAARRLCDRYGAWKRARTAGRETHTTLGPTPRRAASGGRKWEVDVVLLFSGLASIDGSESVSNSFANGRR